MKDHVDVELPRLHSQEEISSRSGGGELEQEKGRGRGRGEEGGPNLTHWSIVMPSPPKVNPENLQRPRWVQASEQFIETNTKPCPRCRVPIEKNGE